MCKAVKQVEDEELKGNVREENKTMLGRENVGKGLALLTLSIN